MSEHAADFPPEVDVDMPEHYGLDTELDDAQRARWFIDSDVLASWAMRKLAALRMAQRRDDAISAAEYERIDRWFSRRYKARERDVEFFMRHLEDYGRRQRAAGRKSLSLPTGTVRTREVRGSLVVTNADAAVAWAEANAPDLLTVTVSLNKAAAKRHLAETGELPDGCEVAPDRLSVAIDTESDLTPFDPGPVEAPADVPPSAAPGPGQTSIDDAEVIPDA